MKFMIVIGAFFASAILVLPTVSQAQEHKLAEHVRGAAEVLRA